MPKDAINWIRWKFPYLEREFTDKKLKGYFSCRKSLKKKEREEEIKECEEAINKWHF